MNVKGQARCVITDGTTVINLLAGGFGFHVDDWKQQTAEYKSGGVWQESSLTDGRRLVDSVYAYPVETFHMKANAGTQDALIVLLRRLRHMLERAAAYWKTGRGNPVWLEVKASYESNIRYAVVIQGRIAEEGNPFAQPFLPSPAGAVYDDLTLAIERGHWLADPPGQTQAQALSAQVSAIQYAWRLDYEAASDIYPVRLYQFGDEILVGLNTGIILQGAPGSGFTPSGISPIDTATSVDRALDIYSFTTASLTGGQYKRDGQVTIQLPAGNYPVVATGLGVFVGATVQGYSGIQWLEASTSMMVFNYNTLATGPDGLLYLGGAEYQGNGVYRHGVFRSADAITWTVCFDAATPPGPVQGEWVNRIWLVYCSRSGLMYAGDELNLLCFSVDTPAYYDSVAYIQTDTGIGEWDLLYEPPEGALSADYIYATCHAHASTETKIMRAPVPPSSSDWTLDIVPQVGHVNAMTYHEGVHYLAAGETQGVMRSSNGWTWEAAPLAPEYYATDAITFRYLDPNTGWQNLLVVAARYYLYLGTTTEGEILADVAGGIFSTYGDTVIGPNETTLAVPVANMHVRNQLTHVMSVQDAGEGNVYRQLFPDMGQGNQTYQAFVSVMFTGAEIYFTSAYNPGSEAGPFGHFTNLVFDIVTPSSTNLFTWAYLATGGTWKTLTVVDETDGFTSAGVRCVSWLPPADWSQRTLVLDGVSYLGYHVRCHHTGNSMGSAIPPSFRGPIYACSTPYVDLTSVRGDLPAAAKVSLQVSGDWFTRLMLAERSLDRGEDFTPFLTLSSYLPPVGVTITTDSAGTQVDDRMAPDGCYCIQGSTVANSWRDVVTVSITDERMRNYYGVYRLYLRYRLLNTSEPIYVRLKVQSGSGQAVFYTDYEALAGGPWVFGMANLGRLTLPLSAAIIAEEIADSLEITVQIKGAHTALTARFYDVILFPVDEWAGNIYDSALSDGARAVYGSTIELDSASSPLNFVRAVVKNAQGQVRSVWQPITAGEFKVTDDTRLWLLMGRYPASGEIATPMTNFGASSATEVYGLSFSTGGYGLAVGKTGTLYAYSPLTLTWTALASGTTQTLYGVDHVSDTYAFAVGAAGLIVRVLSGVVTSQTVGGGAAALYCIAMASSTMGWILGNQVAYRWNGSTWTAHAPGISSVTARAVHMYSETLGLAVGDGGKALKYDENWRKVDNDDVLDMNAVVFTGAKTGWAVGKTGAIYQITGSTWKRVASPTNGTLNGLCIYPRQPAGDYHLYAVGATQASTSGTSSTGNTPIILHYYSGVGYRRWERCTVVPTVVEETSAVPDTNLLAVSMADATHGYAVGTGGKILKTTDGINWAEDTFTGQLTVDLTAVQVEYLAGAAQPGYYGVFFGKGLAYQFAWPDGGAETFTQKIIDTTGTVYAVDRDTTIATFFDSFWAVGEAGAILHYTAAAGRFYQAPSTATANLRSIIFYQPQSGSAVAGSAWIVGEYGTIMRWNGSDFESLTFDVGKEPTLKNLYGVGCAGQGRFGAVGAEGIALYYDSGWQLQTTPVSASLRAVLMTDENNAWVVGDGGNILRFSYDTWEAVGGNFPGFNLRYIFKLGDLLFAGGQNGLLRYNGDEWEVVLSDTGVAANAAATASGVDAWLGGLLTGSIGGVAHWLAPCWDWSPSKMLGKLMLRTQCRYLAGRGDESL